MYGKFFASAFTGSMMGAGGTTFAVWVYAISNADEKGYVELNPNLLAAVIGEKPDAIVTAIKKLTAPDPNSRSRAEDGRRLVREGQFIYWIVNYTTYRAMRDQDERRGYQRKWAKAKRSGSEPREYLDRRGRVYFIKCAESVKIGFSANPWARLAHLKTGLSSTPMMLGHFAGTMADEKAVHEKFAHLRENLEWFRAAPELLAYVQAKVAAGSDIKPVLGPSGIALSGQYNSTPSTEEEGDEEGEKKREVGSDPSGPPGPAASSEPASGYSDPCTPHGLIAAIRKAMEREHPEMGFYAPGQWAAKAAREFIEAIPLERRTDDLREEIRRRVEAFARTTDKRITKGRWLVEAFCDGYNQLADAGGAGDLELAASRLAGRKVDSNR